MGYVLGDNWTAAETMIRPVAWAVAVAIAAGGIWWITRRWRQVREEYAALERERTDQPS
jgi:membrane protein DedA with SNARE-associated domain